MDTSFGSNNQYCIYFFLRCSWTSVGSVHEGRSGFHKACKEKNIFFENNGLLRTDEEAQENIILNKSSSPGVSMVDYDSKNM